MKYKNLAIILAVSSFGFSAMNGVAHAEKIAAPTVENAATPNGNELEMFRFALEMDKEDFVKKSLALDAAQEKKFLNVYYVFNAKLKALNDKRLAIITDYLNNVDKLTDAKAGELAKRTIEFRKKRIALDGDYYAAVAKATTKTIAARALQIENFLQGAGDVAIGSKLPLIPK
ncbi:TPM domain-containing protein [Methylobacter psychrophilus]|uniref:TPM domain-containing protein n=1 Tax=Methylobacter psychrophilus TaxID=96941 RepID=UPI0021D4A4FA|nr:TPM domain-containing protein [Methylobacter psychrophilus]